MTKSEWDWILLGDDEGRVDRPSAMPTWSAPPEVELDGQWLLFRYPVRTLRHGRRALQFRRVRASAGLLTEFVTFDEAPAERILAYARQHGPLGFCRHGDPSHRARPEGCAPAIATGQTALREALQWWRNLASHARALLNAAAQLFKGRVDDLTLARLNPGLFLSPPLLLRVARRDPASFVAFGMELWLRYFQVRPRAIYNRRRKRFEVRIGGSSALAGALALQIVLALTRWSGIAVCSSCGKLFAPSRRPNPNRNAYCDTCGIRAAWRAAQSRRRERKLTNRKAERGQRHPSISRRH
jgi:hypothetical protein